MSKEKELNQVETAIKLLDQEFKTVINKVKKIKIGDGEIFPFGWRKAAKGRTVWRILEECLNQQLEINNDKSKNTFVPAESEVGVYDFRCTLNGVDKEVYVNIKSATKGRINSKDDLSKAKGLIDFYNENPDSHIFIATFEIEFHDDMSISFSNSYVMPMAWIPDVYVNPSNNGNLQSAKYKDLNLAVKRTNKEFLKALKDEIEVANQKRTAKTKKK